MMDSPFFIVGCGRSGTTLLRSMLNQHSRLAIPFESLFMIDYLRAQERVSVETLKSVLLKDYEFANWNLQVERHQLAGIETATELMDRIHELFLSKTGKKRWGQKTPRFIRYWRILKRHYPESKFLVMLRDPRAVASSLIRSPLHRSNILYAARRWRMDVEAGIELKGSLPEDVLEVRYEELVTEPEGVLRAICRFLGEEYEDGMLRYHLSGTAKYNRFVSSIHGNLNRPPTPDRLKAWRAHLSERQVNLLEYVARKQIRELGYGLEVEPRPPASLYIIALHVGRNMSVARQFLQRLFRYTRPFLSFFYRKIRLGTFFEDLGQMKL